MPSPIPDESQHRYGTRRFTPIVARTHAIIRPIKPGPFDCVTLCFVRSGSAILDGEFGERSISVGDVLAVPANMSYGTEPDGRVTVTTLYLDRDYLVDQVFWQHVAQLTDRLDAQDLMDDLYPERAHIIRLGEHRGRLLAPWLDEMVALSVEGRTPEKFYRVQALLFAVLDVLAPYVKTAPAQASVNHCRPQIRPAPPRLRRFHPLRAEASEVRDLLRSAIASPWTLAALAERVHLSPKQLSRVFVEAYGKTPLTYLTMLRVEQMARLLRDTDMSLSAIGRVVGWSSRSRAAQAFRQYVGVSPRRYRECARAKR